MFSETEIVLKNVSLSVLFLNGMVSRVSDGNGYPFLSAKKIAVNVATRAAGHAVARDTPKI